MLDTLFPRFCVRCAAEGQACCEACIEAYVPRASQPACPFCGHAGEARTCGECRPVTYLDGLTALYAYGDPVVRKALTTWKYVGDEAYAAVVERWVRQSDRTLPVGEKAPLVPVALHRLRKRERGFDQAELFAQWVSQMSSRPFAHLLIRVKRTSAQALRGHTSRLVGDLDNVFEAKGDVPSDVILCDDVFTSGATMDAAARCLKEAGASVVWGLSIAKG